MLSRSSNHLHIHSLNLLSKYIPRPCCVLGLMLSTEKGIRHHHSPQSFYSPVGDTCTETTVIWYNKDCDVNLYKRQQWPKRDHTRNKGEAYVGADRVGDTWSMITRMRNNFPNRWLGGHPRQRTTANAKALRHESCLGKCKKILELECAVQVGVKGKGKLEEKTGWWSFNTS